METVIKSNLLRREKVITPLAYSIRDAATALGIGRTTLYRLIQDGQLAVVKVGARTLIPAGSLVVILDRGAGRVDEAGQSSALDG